MKIRDERQEIHHSLSEKAVPANHDTKLQLKQVSHAMSVAQFQPSCECPENDSITVTFMHSP